MHLVGFIISIRILMYTHNMKCYLNTLIGFGDKAYKQTDTTFVQFLHFARKFHFL